jgi:hypothetical protein
LRSRARQLGPSIADGPTPKRGRSGAQTDSPPMSRASTFTQRKKGTHGQNKYNAHGRLVKADLTFDQLLVKYASKKFVLRDRPTKKPRSPAKTKRSNKTT